MSFWGNFSKSYRASFTFFLYSNRLFCKCIFLRIIFFPTCQLVVALVIGGCCGRRTTSIGATDCALLAAATSQLCALILIVARILISYLLCWQQPGLLGPPLHSPSPPGLGLELRQEAESYCGQQHPHPDAFQSMLSFGDDVACRLSYFIVDKLIDCVVHINTFTCCASFRPQNGALKMHEYSESQSVRLSHWLVMKCVSDSNAF